MMNVRTVQKACLLVTYVLGHKHVPPVSTISFSCKILPASSANNSMDSVIPVRIETYALAVLMILPFSKRESVLSALPSMKIVSSAQEETTAPTVSTTTSSSTSPACALSAIPNLKDV